MKILYVLLAVLLIQAALAKKKKSSSSSSSEEKKSKVKTPQCPQCPPQSLTVLRVVTICQNENKILRCPPGTTIRIKDAFYGRKEQYTCPHDNMSDLNCSAEGAMTAVKQRCDQRAICNLQDVNTWFDDPCADTYKYLELDYVCEPRSGRRG